MAAVVAAWIAAPTRYLKHAKSHVHCDWWTGGVVVVVVQTLLQRERVWRSNLMLTDKVGAYCADRKAGQCMVKEKNEVKGCSLPPKG